MCAASEMNNVLEFMCPNFCVWSLKYFCEFRMFANMHVYKHTCIHVSKFPCIANLYKYFCKFCMHAYMHVYTNKIKSLQKINATWCSYIGGRCIINSSYNTHTATGTFYIGACRNRESSVSTINRRCTENS